MLPLSEDWCLKLPGLVGVYSHSLVQSPTCKREFMLVNDTNCTSGISRVQRRGLGGGRL